MMEKNGDIASLYRFFYFKKLRLREMKDGRMYGSLSFMAFEIDIFIFSTYLQNLLSPSLLFSPPPLSLSLSLFFSK